MAVAFSGITHAMEHVEGFKNRNRADRAKTLCPLHKIKDTL